MTIDPLYARRAEQEFTSQGAYGEKLATKNLTPKKSKTPKQEPKRPYSLTLTGLEVPSPGQSAESIQARTAAENAGKMGAGGKDSGASNTGRKVTDTYTAPDGTTFTDQMAYATYLAALKQEEFDKANKMGERKSAFSLLKEEFDRYGLGDLVGDVETLARQGLSPAEYSLELRKLPSYKDRFKANEARINSGLRALSEAEYVNLEDQYQAIMRQYGMPKSFYSTGKAGRQPELEKFISGDVSPVELEDRIQLATERVKNAAPEVIDALTKYYGGPGGISQSNLVSYVLDPERALPEIRRKIQAAEIGAAGMVAGMAVAEARAAELVVPPGAVAGGRGVALGAGVGNHESNGRVWV